MQRAQILDDLPWAFGKKGHQGREDCHSGHDKRMAIRRRYGSVCVALRLARADQRDSGWVGCQSPDWPGSKSRSDQIYKYMDGSLGARGFPPGRERRFWPTLLIYLCVLRQIVRIVVTRFENNLRSNRVTTGACSPKTNRPDGHLLCNHLRRKVRFPNRYILSAFPCGQPAACNDWPSFG